MKKVWKFFGCLWPLAAFVGSQAIAGAVIGFVIGFPMIYGAILKGESTEESMNQFTTWLNGSGMTLVVVMGTIVPALIGLIWYSTKYKKEDALPRKEVLHLPMVGIMFGTAISMSVLITCLLGLVSVAFPDAMENYGKLVEQTGLGKNPWVILSAILIAPIGEELFFRGIILTKARRIMPFLAANILQAVLFGIAHGNIIQGSYAFLLGLVLGLVRYRYQSIYPSMLLHMFFNILGQSLPYLYPENTIFFIVVVILALAVGVCMIRKIVKHPRVELISTEKVAVPEEEIEEIQLGGIDSQVEPSSEHETTQDR